MVAGQATLGATARAFSPIPNHVAIIMDGNGRWARQHKRPRSAGHRAGTQNIRRVLAGFAHRGVKYVTIYAFSTENWTRPKREVQSLFRILGEAIGRETKALHEEGVRIVHLGQMENVPNNLQQAILKAQELTKGNAAITLGVAFNYGGRAEIIQAVRRILAEEVQPEDIDEVLFSKYLSTANIPDPDLIIRTAGEMRLSNFLVWQAAYSEYYSTPTLWPDFDEKEIELALQAYSQRKRRFGGL